MWGRREYQYPGQHLGSGNRCGHNPDKPDLDRLALPKTKSGFRPKIQQALIDAAKDYFFAPQALPLLSNLSRRVNRDGTPRKNRSEGREAESLVLPAILSMTDFCSLRVGTPMPDGTFKPRSMDEIARACGLVVASRDPGETEPVASRRFYRTIKRLKRAAAITVFEQYEEKPDGTKRARVAIKAVSENFLIALGRVSFAALKEFRDECSRKLRNWRNSFRKARPGDFDAVKAAELVRREQLRQGFATHKPKRKNLTPKTLVDANGHEQSQADYSAWCALLEAQLVSEAAEQGRRLGLKERLEGLRRLGLLTYDQWRIRQLE
jgi:hypothetical protein